MHLSIRKCFLSLRCISLGNCILEAQGEGRVAQDIPSKPLLSPEGKCPVEESFCQSCAKLGQSQHCCYTPTVLMEFRGCCWVPSVALGILDAVSQGGGGMCFLLMVSSPKLLYSPPVAPGGSHLTSLSASGERDGQEEKGSPGALDSWCPHQCPCIVLDGNSQLAVAPPQL